MVFRGVEPSVPISTKDVVSYVFDAPEYDIDKPIFLDTSNVARSVSSRQACALVRQLAAGLRREGLKRGDCVCVHSFNDIYYPILFLGILAAGGVFAGTNPAYTQHELSHVVKVTKAKFMIAEPELLEPLLGATNEAKIPKEHIFIFNSSGQAVPKGYSSWQKLFQHGEEDWVRFDDLNTSQSTTAAMFTSSGTTGLPKACKHTHHNLVAQDTLIHLCDPRPYHFSRIVATPLFHVAIAPYAFVSALKSGFQTYVMRRFNLELFLSTMEKHQVTDMLIVPPIAIAIIMSPLSKKYSLKGCRGGICGAAPMEKSLQKRLHDLMPDSKFAQAWGMTETTCIGFRFPWPETDDTGSIGRLIPGLEAKIIDDDGKDISEYDVQGELCLRGPTVIPGYYENDAANKASFDADGWLKTGDLVRCDREEKWYIVDRKKELIKVRGFQVAPPELEAVLLSHPSVVDTAVIGVTITPEQGEVPRAYIVLRQPPTPPPPPPQDQQPPASSSRSSSNSNSDDSADSATTLVKEIRHHAEARLARFKRLDGGVRVVEEIPKTASGKILKKVLREWAKRELEIEDEQQDLGLGAGTRRAKL